MIDADQLTATHIRAARAALDLPQRTFAALAGIHETTLAFVENGDRRNRKTLRAIANALDEAGIVILADGIRFGNAGIRAPAIEADEPTAAAA